MTSLLTVMLGAPVHIGGPPKPPGPAVIQPYPDGPSTASPKGRPARAPGATTSAGASASTSSGSSSGVTTRGDDGRAAGSRGGSGRSSASTATGSAIEPLDTWEVWWTHNQDALLDIKAARVDGRTVSGSPGQLTGRGRKRSAITVHRVSQEDVDQDVVPALLRLLDDRTEREILNSATLALGRMVGTPRRAEVSERLAQLLSHDELQVRASAALGLGAAGGSSTDGPLLALMRDDSSGRGLVGGGRVNDLVRGVSALSLGLNGDARAVYSLLDAIRRLPDSDRDVKASAVAALGLLPADHPRAQVAQVVLMELLGDKGLDPVVASVIPTTLGKMDARESLPLLIERLADRDADVLVRQSCAIALGQLASLEDQAVFEALLTELELGRDRPTRHFSLIALGRLGAKGRGEAADHNRLRLALMRELRGEGTSREHRSWAALATALYGRGHPVAADSLAPSLLAAWGTEHDPSFRGAFALAAALLGQADSQQLLLTDLGSPDDGLAGHAALGLGLLEAKDATPAIRALLQRPGAAPDLRIRAATALALLTDVDSITDLVDVMKGGASYEEQAAITKALGLLGDARSLAPLLSLALDEDAELRDRGFACVALGLLGERSRLPFHAELRAGTNYLAQIEPLVQVAQIL